MMMEMMEDHMTEKIFYVTVKIITKNNTDAQEIVSEMDYGFSHKDIIETEIIDLDDGGSHD